MSHFVLFQIPLENYGRKIYIYIYISKLRPWNQNIYILACSFTLRFDCFLLYSNL